MRGYFGTFLVPMAVSALVVVAGYAAQLPFSGHLARLAAAGVVGGAVILAANGWANRDLADLLRRGRRAVEGSPPESGAAPT